MATCETRKILRVVYPAPATRCVRRLRVFPRGRRGSQQVLDVQWDCVPQPTSWSESEDDFGNRVLELRHARIEDEFRFGMTLISARRSCDAPRDEGLPPTGVGAFVLPSPHCYWADEVRQVVAQLRDARQIVAGDTERNAARLCAWAHQALKYTPDATGAGATGAGATGAGTTISQLLARGAGVCQDYAHLMIALCRAAQMPARYVSGYNPTQGLMHAWVEVLRGDVWQAWDPTHNRRVGDDHVFVACGRDFHDVVPSSGSYFGQRGARLETRCGTKVMKGPG